MAVQAQNQSRAFAPDFRGRDRDALLVVNPSNALFGTHVHLGEQQKILINGAGISDPESELTCNASGSRKRSRGHGEVMVLPQPGRWSNHPQQQQQHQISRGLRFAPVNSPNYPGLQPSYEQSRLQGSAGTSTSGRTPAISPLAQDLFSRFHHQSVEIDAVIGFQSEKFRSELEEARKRHCRALISILEQRAEKRLKEMESELENVRRRNAELEEKARQVEAESKIWFNAAKSNEALAASLRATLEQVLLQNAAAAGGGGWAEEGYGDSDGAPFPADDAQSCCFEEAAAAARGISGGGGEELRWRRSCKACGEKEVAFALLPCRHLCLCTDCESMIDTCPICQSWKSASFQVLPS